MLDHFKSLLEYLGGATEAPGPEVPQWMRGPLFWGIWWAVMIFLVLAFSGQTSKFIYIDF